MMNETKLEEVLDSHKAWLSGKDGRRADLRHANLQGADLQGADLRRANLRRANLQDANLQGADLQGADLQDANLWRADLQDANLQGADLQGADLRRANLQGANLRHANLQDANLQGANLQGAGLRGATLPPFQLPPSEGSFIGWKKVAGVVVKLKIPTKAQRTSSLVGRKCRASEVKTLKAIGQEESWSAETNPYLGTKARYQVGKRTFADRFDDDIRVECTNGIHFFMTQQEAEDWE